MPSLSDSPAKIVRQWLVDQTAVTLPSASGAWPCYRGKMSDTGNAAAGIYDTTGKIEGREMQGGVVHTKPGIQLRMRSKDYDEVYAKINAVATLFESLQRAAVTVGAKTYLIQSVTQTSDITAIGRDDQDRMHFTLNLIVTVKATN